MNKTIKIIVLLLFSLSLSSCVELVEEIRFNADLSGKYHIYLKHNGLDFLFNSLTKNLDLSGLDEGLKSIESQEGIRNLKTDIQPKKGKFSIQFDFDNARSLTKAFYASIGVKKQFYHTAFIKASESKIKRPNLTPYLLRYIKNSDLKDQIPSGKILDYVKYRYHIIGPENISKSTPANIALKPNEYTQIYPLKAIIIDKASTKSIIKY